VVGRHEYEFDYHSMMYLEFFKLKQLPFRLTADVRFHYKETQRAAAVNKLLSFALGAPSGDSGGCVLVSGDAGVGKTILVHEVLSQLPETHVIVQIRQPEISIAEFHQAIAAELGNGETLHACLAAQAALGRHVILSLDNGELMTQALLDEIFRLGARDGTVPGSLRIVLAARSAPESGLGGPNTDHQAMSPALSIKLLPLSVDDMRGYIEHRLRIAGRKGAAIFSADALAEMQRFTGGMPRLINMLADAALIAAFNRSHDTITAVEVRAAASQLQWVEFDVQASGGAANPTVAEERAIGHVRIEHNAAVVAEFDLPPGKVSLGRSSNNDVRIDSTYVSRNHCRIVTTAQYSVIEDLQSQNGLVIAARRVSVHRLRHGDRIQIGEHTLVYTRPGVPEAAKSAGFPMNLASTSGASEIDQTGVIVRRGGPSEALTPKDCG
jgi:type II secretory pathway predicted ATPase ExeA